MKSLIINPPKIIIYPQRLMYSQGGIPSDGTPGGDLVSILSSTNGIDDGVINVYSAGSAFLEATLGFGPGITPVEGQSWHLFKNRLLMSDIDGFRILWNPCYQQTGDDTNPASGTIAMNLTLITDTFLWNPFTLNFNNKPALSANDLTNNTIGFQFSANSGGEFFSEIGYSKPYMRCSFLDMESLNGLFKANNVPVYGAVCWAQAQTSVVNFGLQAGIIHLTPVTHAPPAEYPVIARSCNNGMRTLYMGLSVFPFKLSYTGNDVNGNPITLGASVFGVGQNKYDQEHGTYITVPYDGPQNIIQSSIDTINNTISYKIDDMRNESKIACGGNVYTDL